VPGVHAEPTPHLSLATVDGSRVGADAEELGRRLDAVNLEQALIDVEIANARVLDLTARLVESNRRVLELQVQLDEARTESRRVVAEAEAVVDSAHSEMAAHDAYLEQQRSSTAYRWAAKVWNLRNALRS
jgi:hypothetical protein